MGQGIPEEIILVSQFSPLAMFIETVFVTGRDATRFEWCEQAGGHWDHPIERMTVIKTAPGSKQWYSMNSSVYVG